MTTAEFKRVCYACGTFKTTLNMKGCPQWTRNWGTDLYLCQVCTMLIFRPRFRHRPKLGEHEKVCYGCSSKYSTIFINTKGEKQSCWYYNPPTRLVLCYNCYLKYYMKTHTTMIRNKEKEKIRQARRFKFLGKTVYCWKPLRTGICTKCGRSKHKMEVRITHMHHQFYIPIMPWLSMIELCDSCHGSLTYLLGQSCPHCNR